MNFGEALSELKKGKKITTKGWGDAYIKLHIPNDLDIISMSYIYMVLSSKEKIVWMPTHTEILDDNWSVVE